jgi:magnesium transporter
MSESTRSPEAVNRGQRVRALTAAGTSDVSPQELPVLLSGLSDPAGPVIWIHTGPDPSIAQALDDMGLDEIVVKSLRDGPERPRVEEFVDHIYISLIYISLFAPETVAGADSQGIRGTVGGVTPACTPVPRLRELRLFMGPRWIISVGDLSPVDYEVLAERMHRQVFARGRGASFIAYHICEWLVERLQPALDYLGERLDALEDQVALVGGNAPIQELFGLKRDVVELRRRVSPLRDVMQRLGSHGVLYVDVEAEPYFRDVHDDVMRAIELLDTYRDILSSALDLYLSSVSTRLNRAMKQLTVVATVFMPLSFIVGLFGTNFVDMPFGSTVWFILMFVLLLVALVGMVVYTRWRT